MITKAPEDGAYTTEYAEQAVAQLEEEGEDVNGEGYQKEDVEVTPGGE